MTFSLELSTSEILKVVPKLVSHVQGVRVAVLVLPPHTCEKENSLKVLLESHLGPFVFLQARYVG